MGDLRPGPMAGKRSPHRELRTAMGGASGIHGKPGRYRQLRPEEWRYRGTRYSPEQNRTIEPVAFGQLQRVPGLLQCLLFTDEKYVASLLQCGDSQPGSLVSEPAQHLFWRLRPA